MISLLRNIYGRIYDHWKLCLFIVIIVIAFFVARNKLNVNPNVDVNSEQYVNSLYMSDGKAYEGLTSKQQDMYKFIMSKIKAHKRVTKGALSEYGCVDYDECISYIRKAADAIIIDHPELLSFGSWNAQYKDGTLTLRLESSFKLPLMDEIGEMYINYKIDQIQNDTIGMSDKEKVKYVYEWIADNAEYDQVFTSASKNQTIYNVFINKNAVCAGFAKTSQVLFQALGIESYAVTGTTSGLHMWNIIKLDGKYYYFDSTWAACMKHDSDHFYDGLKQSTFSTYQVVYPIWGFNMSKTELFTEADFN